jgi:hypothetical protein
MFGTSLVGESTAAAMRMMTAETFQCETRKRASTTDGPSLYYSCKIPRSGPFRRTFHDMITATRPLDTPAQV